MVASDPNDPRSPAAPDPAAGERYLLLADISGYTSFLAGVEEAHGVDFSEGTPAGYPVLGALLGAISDGLASGFAVVKYEGDAVFAAAPAAGLDGQGDRVLDELQAVYEAFIAIRTAAVAVSDHVCTACPAVARLDLKMVLHRGPTVRQSVGTSSDLLGPAVTAAHRLLKNTVRDHFGSGPYLFMTDAASTGLGVGDAGRQHLETYPDIGTVRGQVVPLGTLPTQPSVAVPLQPIRIVN
jgi:class 3 adenylate cyclase